MGDYGTCILEITFSFEDHKWLIWQMKKCQILSNELWYDLNLHATVKELSTIQWIFKKSTNNRKWKWRQTNNKRRRETSCHNWYCSVKCAGQHVERTCHKIIVVEKRARIKWRWPVETIFPSIDLFFDYLELHLSLFHIKLLLVFAIVDYCHTL